MAGHTTNLGLWYPDGTDPISAGDDGIRENANLVDNIFAPYGANGNVVDGTYPVWACFPLQETGNTGGAHYDTNINGLPGYRIDEPGLWLITYYIHVTCTLDEQPSVNVLYSDGSASIYGTFEYRYIAGDQYLTATYPLSCAVGDCVLFQSAPQVAGSMTVAGNNSWYRLARLRGDI